MAAMTPCRRRSSERGNALIEFAMVLPLLLLIFAGIVDFGLLLQRYEVVTNAAREGARLASLPGYEPSDVRLRVRHYVQQGLGLTSAQALAALPDANIGVAATSPAIVVNGKTIPATTVTVTFQHNYIILGPIMGLFGGTWANSNTVNATSTMRIEVPAP